MPRNAMISRSSEPELTRSTPLGYMQSMGPRPVSVIEFAAYRRRADELLTAGEQDAVIDLVAYDPTCGDLIPGTGGLRKVRVGA
jgi:hypothetical protein